MKRAQKKKVMHFFIVLRVKRSVSDLCLQLTSQEKARFENAISSDKVFSRQTRFSSQNPQMKNRSLSKIEFFSDFELGNF